MASHPTPNLFTFKAGGTIIAGHALKFGSDAKTVVEATASTDESIGLADGAAVSGDPVNVQMPGGGGKAKLGATVTRGQLLVSHTDGSIKKVSGANDRIVAVALDSGVSGDVIPVFVIIGQATATEA